MLVCPSIVHFYLKELVDKYPRKLWSLFFCCIQNLALRYGHPKDIQRAESRGFDRYGSLEENWDHLRDAPGSSGYRQVARGRGGRPRGKSQKGVINSAPSGKRSTKQGETLTQFLLQQGMSAPGQKHKRGRRTLRRRRPEKKVVAESKFDDLYDKDAFMNAVEEPENSGREEAHDFGARNIVDENDDSSNNMDGDSDDNVDENSYHYRKWGATTYDTISHRSTELVEMSEEEEADEIDDEQGYDEEDGENLGGGVGFNDDYSDQDGEGNQDDGSESLVSGDYSDD